MNESQEESQSRDPGARINPIVRWVLSPAPLLVAIFILLAVIIALAVRSSGVVGLAAADAPTPPAPQTYHNELYYFRVEPDDYIATLDRAADATDCDGVVFWDDPRGDWYVDEAVKQIRICHVADVTEETAETLQRALDERAELIKGQLDGVKVGVVRQCALERRDLPCIERHLQGANALHSSGVEWYQAVVAHGHRLFAIEATGNSDDWEEQERAVQRVLSTLHFDAGVMPP